MNKIQDVVMDIFLSSFNKSSNPSVISLIKDYQASILSINECI